MNVATMAGIDWEDVYKTEWDYIVGMCCKFCKNHDLAKDLAQETFLQAWRFRGNFKGDSKIRTWLHRIAVNQCLTWIRRGKARPMEICEAAPDANIHPQVEAADPALNLALVRAIAALPNGYRRVFIGHGVEGLAHTQVGERLGISQGCSKSQFTRAVRKLKQSLGKYGVAAGEGVASMSSPTERCALRSALLSIGKDHCTTSFSHEVM